MKYNTKLGIKLDTQSIYARDYLTQGDHMHLGTYSAGTPGRVAQGLSVPRPSLREAVVMVAGVDQCLLAAGPPTTTNTRGSPLQLRVDVWLRVLRGRETRVVSRWERRGRGRRGLLESTVYVVSGLVDVVDPVLERGLSG